MRNLTLVLLWIVVVAHVGFVALEMFPWERPLVFDRVHLGFDPLSNEAKAAPIVHNAGLYNAFLAAGLVWGILSRRNALGIRIFFLSCAIAAGVFGSFTLTPTTLFLQSIPGALALTAVLATRSAEPAASRATAAGG
jgi:putative membrane protein